VFVSTFTIILHGSDNVQLGNNFEMQQHNQQGTLYTGVIFGHFV